MGEKLQKFIPKPVLTEITKTKNVTLKQARKISEKTGTRLMTLYEIATFYEFINTKKTRENEILVCNCVSCNLNGAGTILKTLRKELKGVRTVQNLGLCDKPPAITVNGKPITKLTKEKMEEVIKACKS